MAPRAKRNYVNNKDLFEALSAYLVKCQAVEDFNKANVEDDTIPEKRMPQVPSYIGECIFHIATRLASKSNFSGYAYRDDMVMDGVENCLQYIRNFKPEKSNNPFAYFTSIIWYAFIRRIQKEKKQMYIRYKSSHNMIGNGGTYESDEVQLHLTTSADYINDFVAAYEEGMDSKRAKNKKDKTPLIELDEALDDAIEILDAKLGVDNDDG